jgi:hypothetical protein
MIVCNIHVMRIFILKQLNCRLFMMQNVQVNNEPFILVRDVELYNITSTQLIIMIFNQIHEKHIAIVY